MPALGKEFAHIAKVLRGEGALAHAGGVGFNHADHAVDAPGAKPRADAGSAGGGVGGGDEGVGAEVDIEHGALCAL